MTVVMCVLLVMSLVLLLLILPLSVQVSFQRKEGDDSGEVDIRYLFGVVRIRRQLVGVDAKLDAKGPRFKLRHESAGTGPAAAPDSTQHTIGPADIKHFIYDLPEWVKLLERVRPTVKTFLSRVHVQLFRWHVVLGTGDAVTSGVSCGAAWSALSVTAGMLSDACRLDKMPDLSVKPDFEHARLDTSFECIVRVRAGYAITAGIRLIRAWRRRRTRGASDSGIDAHGHDKHP